MRYDIDGAVVRALKGQAETSRMTSVGDFLYKVNETDVHRVIAQQLPHRVESRVK